MGKSTKENMNKKGRYGNFEEALRRKRSLQGALKSFEKSKTGDSVVRMD